MLFLTACEGPADSLGLVFLDGRAVAAMGDSLLVMTAEGVSGVLLYDIRNETLDTIAEETLNQPVHIEIGPDRWYVSDTRGASARIAVLNFDGTLDRWIELAGISRLAHQFALLPDQRIVVQSPDGQLIFAEASDDSAEVFALTDLGVRPNLMAGVAGGVFQAVQGHHMTLYNEFGNIRWRTDWPWAETAFFTDIAVDRQERIHLLAAVPNEEIFLAYTVGRTDGAIIRWSEDGTYATFTVERNGRYRPDSTVAWLR
ncbi:MAG: hypothetical protein OEZ54_00885 [Gemmatimonadota bacterium]|nr:hypothetical protein [Gemmatimonadota bacterium]